MFVRKLGVGSVLLMLSVWVWAKTPPTQSAVTHPKTQITVIRPMTQVPVFKPETHVPSNQPKTEVVVKHPKTPEPGAAAAAGGAGGTAAQAGAKASTEKAVNTVPSSSSPTSMSGFKLPQPKDLKPGSLTKGEEGLGKPNDAEKRAEAEAFTVPKAESATAENLKQMADKVQGITTGNVAQKLENKIAENKSK